MVDSLTILAPLFIAIAGGFFLGRWRKLPPRPFVQAVMDLFMPALVFGTMMTEPVTLRMAAGGGAAALIVLTVLFLFCLAARPVMKKPLPEFALPVLFMNSGFLGIPLVKLLMGSAVLNGIVFYDQVQTLCIFTLGITLAASGSGSARESIKAGLMSFVKEPLVISILLALALLGTGVRLPTFITDPIQFIGNVTPAVALFALGIRLAAVRNFFYRGLASGLVLRFGGGLLGGLLAVHLLHLEGALAVIVILASSLPSAVFSYVLAERYDRRPEEAAAFLFVSTLVSIPLIPVILNLAESLTGFSIGS